MNRGGVKVWGREMSLVSNLGAGHGIPCPYSFSREPRLRNGLRSLASNVGDFGSTASRTASHGSVTPRARIIEHANLSFGSPVYPLFSPRGVWRSA